ncbi:hypothetical protein C8R45DRAFT_1221191 [Mycena sanguinolenta]|nr:hypothetical protein C8R45DRAFT_1221191 [Mycena sanguinolenta]
MELLPSQSSEKYIKATRYVTLTLSDCATAVLCSGYERYANAVGRTADTVEYTLLALDTNAAGLGRAIMSDTRELSVRTVSLVIVVPIKISESRSCSANRCHPSSRLARLGARVSPSSPASSLDADAAPAPVTTWNGLSTLARSVCVHPSPTLYRPMLPIPIHTHTPPPLPIPASLPRAPQSSPAAVATERSAPAHPSAT